ncbi:HAD family phosphatase [Sphingorhabdus soli]|uniref:HAD family phosphatase n=1 Tax=Flavisphingopyxis soli TaxID=2601267 RepID=A0A5C6UMV5_9SPHN|nr:HAD family phosphatase [Sphingorhabdus soli]TXC73461.1 HAD family phosphatase [Sphingorhabdus soli]
MSQPTAVIFDVGRVLFEWDLRHLFAKLITDDDALEQFVTTVVTPEWHLQADQGRALDEMIAERIAQFPQHAQLIHAYAERFTETIPGPVAGMPELVARLDAAEVPLYAITNFGHEFWQMFRPAQPVFDRFADIVVSGTEQLAKPDRRIFRLALDRFALAPHQAFFIDDNEDNVAAARAMGITSHHFTDAASLETDLGRFGLL